VLGLQVVAGKESAPRFDVMISTVFLKSPCVLGIREPPVVHHLQQNVEHIGMRFFDLVEQDHRIGPAPHGLSQLAAFV